MMATEVIVALITGGCAVLGQWIISSRSRQSDMAERIRHEAEEDMRLKAIEQRLDSHNAYAKKFDEVARGMTELNIAMAEIRTDVVYLKERTNG